jgi:membrane protein DedA with SNARE-associated domain
MAETVWNLLDSVAAGGAIWLLVILALAILGEMGLPLTSPFLESVLIFTGFQLAHGALTAASLPFLAVAYTGRLVGSTSAYQLSLTLGTKILERWGTPLRITSERIQLLKERLSTVLVPTIILARFTPGFSILTSFLCGATKVSRRQFRGAVAGQLLIWESAFIAAGALGGLASRSIDPSSYPRVLALIIALAISIGALSAYVVFHKTRARPPQGTIHTLSL